MLDTWYETAVAVLAALAALMVALRVVVRSLKPIARLTSTTKDDEILDTIADALEDAEKALIHLSKRDDDDLREAKTRVTEAKRLVEKKLPSEQA